MKIYVGFAFLLISSTLLGQSLSSLNLNHLYDPQQEVSLQMELIRGRDQFTVNYQLLTNNDQNSIDNYKIVWERWESFNARQGNLIEQSPVEMPLIVKTRRAGKLTFPMADKAWQLVAKVTNTTTSKSWTFVRSIDPKYPVDAFVEDENGVVIKPYIIKSKTYIVNGTSGKPLHVDYHKTIFDVASPPFADKQAKPDRFMFPDSAFTIESGAKINFKKEGLYLVQQDTIASEGIAFRVVKDNFPKFTKIEDLAVPLIFVCTKEEHDQLLDAKDDKSKFDKVILDITKDKDRAKNFMRSYFRRVELSNLYFSSYKEGWKTDRGMIYLIFGLPDEVSKTGQKEIWYYKNSQARFTFAKAGSVYDPENYILVRNNNFMETWFNTIDLWRKSRF